MKNIGVLIARGCAVVIAVVITLFGIDYLLFGWFGVLNGSIEDHLVYYTILILSIGTLIIFVVFQVEYYKHNQQNTKSFNVAAVIATLFLVVLIFNNLHALKAP